MCMSCQLEKSVPEFGQMFEIWISYSRHNEDEIFWHVTYLSIDNDSLRIPAD